MCISTRQRRSACRPFPNHPWTYKETKGLRKLISQKKKLTMTYMAKNINVKTTKRQTTIYKTQKQHRIEKKALKQRTWKRKELNKSVCYSSCYGIRKSGKGFTTKQKKPMHDQKKEYTYLLNMYINIHISIQLSPCFNYK